MLGYECAGALFLAAKTQNAWLSRCLGLPSANINTGNGVDMYLVDDSRVEDSDCLRSLSIYITHLLDCFCFSDYIVLVNRLLIDLDSGYHIQLRMSRHDG